MPEFQQTRDDLLQSRNDNEKTRLDLYASKQRLLFLEKERAALDRQKGDNNENYIRRRHELDRLIDAEKNEQSRQQEKTLDRQKAAWALLVKAHGDGRAAWITRQLTPEASSVFPVRGPKTIILAIVSDNWNAAQQTAVVDLFKKLWFANKKELKVKQ